MYQPTVISRLAASLMVALALAVAVTAPASAQQRPNILVIWGDDIGWYNISAYHRGIMGGRTPNIDRIASEGVLFTDAYAQQSCTAGRAAFITGQAPLRTGLLKVGLPGAEEGLQPEDPTLADMLKPLGYTSGQFGKNHLGDRDEHLPTAHGFDEFLGNLYHLNAEEEPENVDYPADAVLADGRTFKQAFGPRGVIHAYADGRIEDTGPLTRKRMETIDDEVTAAALDFIDRAHRDQKPFFVWWNSTRMHVFTHLKPESQNVTGYGLYADGMAEHDGHVGRLLQKLDDLGIADNTIVIYSTDNGAEILLWPDGGMTPFRGEKNTNWEGGYRVPMAIRWPGRIQAGQVSNDIVSQEDWLPTLMAAAGVSDIKERLVAGHRAGAKTFKVHLDGYNLLPQLTGQGGAWPRREFFYFSDDGNLVALRYNRWKLVFAEQRAHGFDVWQEPFVTLRFPKLFDLRADPFERVEHDSENYPQWRAERMYLLVPAQAFVGQFLATFRDFPQRQRVGSFNLDRVMQSLREPQASR